MQRRPSFVPVPEWVHVRGQARASLGSWPTPVHKMQNTSDALGVEVWVKREDLAGAWGGNKVRKLEFWLARTDVWKTRHIIVSGAGGSTWTAASTLHARALGLQVTAALAGEIPDERQKLYSDAGARVVHSSNLNARPLVVAKAKLSAGRKSSRLPMGGSGWPGDLGSFICGEEIVDAALADDLPSPERIYVASGTAGTSAGITAALAQRGIATPVVAVRVAPKPFGGESVVRWRANRLLRKLGTDRSSRPKAISLIGEERFFGKGYGLPGPGVDEAIAMAASDDVELEPTYTAKAFAALIDHARSDGHGPLLFIQTAAGPLPE